MTVMNASATDKIITKINALFAKADSTTSEHEAEALAQKAQELLTKYAIDRARLEESGEAKREEITSDWVWWPKSTPGKVAQGGLSIGIADANNCVVTGGTRWDADAGKYQHTLVFTGYESDVELCIFLYTSLTTQMEIAYHRSRSSKPSHIHGRTWRSSFYSGFADRIKNRLRAAVAKAESDEGMTSALVLVQNKKAEVERHTGHKGYGSTSTNSNEDAYRAGDRAGGSADLGQKRLASQKALG